MSRQLECIVVAITKGMSVDVPASTLRALKIRAIERGQTAREHVLELLHQERIA
jgi:hypothetical protein